jgi:dihydroneopterin aldolase
MQLIDSIIFINRLRLYAFHGVMPQERRVGGWFVVTLRVHYDISQAFTSDDVAHTVNYAQLCQIVESEMSKPSNLLEHVAGRVADAVFGQFPEVSELELSITKENPPMGANCDGAGVEVHLINNKTN